MIDLRRLAAFVAIAEEGHITRAAERLEMQQPPLSRLLRGLETELDVQLMQRLPRGVRPTEAGLALLAEARAVLERADGVANVVQRVARGEQGRLAIGFTSSAALHPFVPSVLRQFRELIPGVELVLEEAGTTELVEGILHERLDAAFVRSSVGDPAALLAQQVLDEPMVVALPTSHHLAVVDGTPLPLSELAADPFVLYRRPEGAGLYHAIISACLQAGFEPYVTQEAPRLPATLSLVAVGLGVSLVPMSMSRINVEGVCYRGLSDCSTLSAPLHLAMRRSMRSVVLRRFHDLVTQTQDRNSL